MAGTVHVPVIGRLPRALGDAVSQELLSIIIDATGSVHGILATVPGLAALGHLDGGPPPPRMRDPAARGALADVAAITVGGVFVAEMARGLLAGLLQPGRFQMRFKFRVLRRLRRGSSLEFREHLPGADLVGHQCPKTLWDIVTPV